MEASVSLRVVRGPDWRWGDQDGGEGCVGTVVRVGKEGRSVQVVWDGGYRDWYRSGAEGKYDLRVLDTAPSGLKFPGVVCSGCYVEGVSGTHWQCAYCYEYHLCHSCYLLGRHCQEHPFFRVQSKKQRRRIKVSPRVDSRKVQIKGIFPGAVVVRGLHWKFEDQDGGDGMTGKVIAIEGWKEQSATLVGNCTSIQRSVARVEWSSTGKTNIYRAGYRGKVDLKCTNLGSKGHYCPDHLSILGSKVSPFFNEDEIAAGDVVVVELDKEVLKMMQESIGFWVDTLPQILGRCGIVLSVLEQQRLNILFYSQRYILVYNAVTKLKHCREGETVRITDDLFQLQKQHSIWDDGVISTLGQIGLVTRVSVRGIAKVIVQGKEWLYNPQCLLPTPGDHIEIEDPQKEYENLGMIVTKNRKTFRDITISLGITDEALLDGNLETLNSFLYSNSGEQRLKEVLLNYYAVTGMIPALKATLESGIDANTACLFEPDTPMTAYCITVNQEESCMALLEAGADVNAQIGARPLVLFAAYYGSFRILRTIVTHPNSMTVDAQIAEGAVSASSHMKLAVLLEAGAEVPSSIQVALNGFIPSMEVFAADASEHLNRREGSNGLTPLHHAAVHGHSGICSILAAQNSVDVDVKTDDKVTPLHCAVAGAKWNAVECLMGWRANLNATDDRGDTALHYITRMKSQNIIPDSSCSQLKKVHNALSRASGGRAVEGYVVVACFLVQEGADFHIKNKEGVSPYQGLPAEVASFIETYAKRNPGTFHGSLCSTQQRRICELPQKFKLAKQVGAPGLSYDLKSKGYNTTSVAKGTSLTLLDAKQEPPSSADDLKSAGFLTSAATKTSIVVDSPRKSSDVKQEPLPSADDLKSAGFVALPLAEKTSLIVKTSSKGDSDSKQEYSPSASPSTEGSPQTQASVLTEPLAESSQPHEDHRSREVPVCLLCEEQPASVKFSPCGHTILCSGCAERAKRCLQCQVRIDSKYEC